MEPSKKQDAQLAGEHTQAGSAERAQRMKPGERRVHILHTLAAMLEAPKSEKITTAALAARLGVSEAALYRQFASKAQMFEALIEFIEATFFGLINQIAEKEPNGVLQARAIGMMLLNFAAKNPGMTRVLTGEALVGEHTRLADRVAQMLERVEASVKQSLRIALMEAHQAQAPQGKGQGQEGETEQPYEPSRTAAPLPDDYDPIVRANLLVSYVVGRWHRYARSGFTRAPAEHAEAQLRLILQ